MGTMIPALGSGRYRVLHKALRGPGGFITIPGGACLVYSRPSVKGFSCTRCG